MPSEKRKSELDKADEVQFAQEKKENKIDNANEVLLSNYLKGKLPFQQEKELLAPTHQSTSTTPHYKIKKTPTPYS
ncbi:MULTISPECIES: hypothetical protein [Bacillus]|uniref:hypothetical protein n=1 Tax=Bacillus TaxID=1386 RepID=UPI001143C4D8|nr:MULTISPECIES: hypothetical protein [Bacillus]